MLSVINEAMLKRHQFRTYYYGNFSTKEALGVELDRFPEAKAEAAESTKVWRTFDHRPRFGNNYVGLRNRLTILSEAYSHLDFRGRINVTDAFVEEILRYSAAHAGEIRDLLRKVDAETIQRAVSGSPQPFAVDFEMSPLPNPVDLLVGEVTRVKHPETGIDMVAMVEDKVTPTRMPYYGIFTAKREVSAGRAYLFAPEPGLRPCLENLRAHGISVEELVAPLTVDVQTFQIEQVKRAPRAFAGHNTMKITGKARRETKTFPAGTLLVRRAQALGTLASYLLEPESDDGLVNWNFLDAYLQAGKDYPIAKLMDDVAITARLADERN